MDTAHTKSQSVTRRCAFKELCITEYCQKGNVGSEGREDIRAGELHKPYAKLGQTLNIIGRNLEFILRKMQHSEIPAEES